MVVRVGKGDRHFNLSKQENRYYMCYIQNKESSNETIIYLKKISIDTSPIC